MGLFNWLGFGRPRDEPEMDGGASLPEVTDRVRDSGQTFFFGTPKFCSNICSLIA